MPAEEQKIDMHDLPTRDTKDQSNITPHGVSEDPSKKPKRYNH